jgi:hypothetical protein
MEPVIMGIGCEVDLGQYEPQWSEERDGLRINAYEVDGQLILDFDWEPGGTWDQLEDPAVFAQFAKKTLEALCGHGEDVVVVDLDGPDAPIGQEETPAAAECTLAGADDGDRDPKNCGCPL